MGIEEFWHKFLEETGKNKDLKYIEAFSFELNEASANKLLNLVLKGKKKATTSSVKYYEITGEKMPQSGDYSIVTDWKGNPKCIIETKKIEIIPFKDVTFDICKREGEDDCLESWQRSHKKFFTNEGKEVGYEFSEDMEVVFEDFAVVYSV